MPELSPRGKLVRDALIYTPLFLACLALVLIMLSGLTDRAWIGIVLLAGMSFLFGYQSIQSLRDLRERPQEVVGEIARRWTKRDAFVSKSYYITVGGGIFRIPVQIYLDLLTRDTVGIIAYPHTGTVLSVDRLSRPDPEEQPAVVESKGRMRTLRTARLTSSPRRSEAPAPRTPGEEPADGVGPPAGATPPANATDTSS